MKNEKIFEMKKFHVMYVPYKKTFYENWYREQTYVYATNIEAARRKVEEFGEVKYVKKVKESENDGME